MDTLLLALRLLLAALLYAFLTVVLLMLWRDLRQTATTREAERPHGHLVILQTEGEALTVGTVFLLQTVTSVGRSPSNTLFLPDPYASTQHALLTWREGQWWLEDQNSRNGTRLNGTRIGGPTIVSAGDIIGVGRTELKLELGDEV
ncbi:MAG: FHA domain-containing protein [Chloroflexi bacterium]|nr:MAG: FHA domain-containing protein [Chloroflexota bacterium]